MILDFYWLSQNLVIYAGRKIEKSVKNLLRI